MNFQITYVDYAPKELYGQVPFTLTLIKTLPGQDRPDYWLCALAKPIKWAATSDEECSVTHVILAARYAGAHIGPETKKITVGIAYVTDESLISDTTLDFAKTKYVAIGEAERVK